ICQDVCPWNRKSPRTEALEFRPRKLAGNEPDSGGLRGSTSGESFFSPELLRLANLSEAEFREVFRRSPIKRTKGRGLVRNACIALGNSGVKPGNATYSEVLKTLHRLSESDDPVIQESAGWALSRIQREGNHSEGA